MRVFDILDEFRASEVLLNEVDAETNLEMFQDFIDDDLVEIKVLIDKAMLKARNYNDTDFREELKDMIIDLI